METPYDYYRTSRREGAEASVLDGLAPAVLGSRWLHNQMQTKSSIAL